MFDFTRAKNASARGACAGRPADRAAPAATAAPVLPDPRKACGLSLRVARRAGALALCRRADGAGAWARLFQRRRFRRLSLLGSRQLPADVGRPAVLAESQGDAQLYAGMLVPALYFSGPGPGAAGAADRRVQRRAPRDLLPAANGEPRRGGADLADADGREDRRDRAGAVADRARRGLVPRRSELGDLRRRLRQRVVPDGLLHADLPRRAAGHPAGVLRGGADRRRRADRELLVHHPAAARARPASSCCWSRWSRRSLAGRRST